MSTQVHCPVCFGNGHRLDAVPDCGDASVTCSACRGVGIVPESWLQAYQDYEADHICEICLHLGMAVYDPLRSLYTCTKCWEVDHQVDGERGEEYAKYQEYVTLVTRSLG